MLACAQRLWEAEKFGIFSNVKKEMLKYRQNIFSRFCGLLDLMAIEKKRVILNQKTTQVGHKMI